MVTWSPLRFPWVSWWPRYEVISRAGSSRPARPSAPWGGEESKLLPSATPMSSQASVQVARAVT
jgi:hypothetical protein